MPQIFPSGSGGATSPQEDAFLRGVFDKHFILEDTTSGAKQGEATTLIEATAMAKVIGSSIAIWEQPDNVKVAEISHDGILWVRRDYLIETSQLRGIH